MGAALKLVKGNNVGYGLPCNKCRTYYPANLERCPVCKNSSWGEDMSAGTLVKKIVADAEADTAKVKAAMLKAVAEVDGVILPDAAKYEPLIAQAATAIAPGGAAVVDTAYAWLEACAKVIDTGGAAAEQNLLNAGLDVSAIQTVKGLIPQLKAAAKG
jgi:RNA polymerase subunit RPABC4/transcription elongation factor Spt4